MARHQSANLANFYMTNFLNPSPATKNFPVKPPLKYFPRTDNFIRQHDNRNVKIVWCRFPRTFLFRLGFDPRDRHSGKFQNRLPSSPQSFKGGPPLICRNEGKTEPAKSPVSPSSVDGLNGHEPSSVGRHRRRRYPALPPRSTVWWCRSCTDVSCTWAVLGEARRYPWLKMDHCDRTVGRGCSETEHEDGEDLRRKMRTFLRTVQQSVSHASTSRKEEKRLLEKSI